MIVLVLKIRFILTQPSSQAIETRKLQYPDRPLIRISSTFFWHLSSDHWLEPIAPLSERARGIRIGVIDGENETIYEPMRVGQQVQK